MDIINHVDQIIHAAAQVIYDKRGSNIFASNIQQASLVTDGLLIAEGNVARHVIGLADAVIIFLKTFQEEPVHIEGLEDGEWVVLDYSNFMVHLMTPEMRRKYQLDQLHPTGNIIDLKLNTAESDKKISG